MNIPKVVYTRRRMWERQRLYEQRVVHLWGYSEYITQQENCQENILTQNLVSGSMTGASPVTTILPAALRQEPRFRV